MYDFRNIAGDGPPVRALQHTLIQTLEKSDPSLIETAKALIAKYGLSPGLVYNTSQVPIIALNANGDLDCNCAQANKANEIEFYETFLSYLWCVSYSLLVFWEEANAKPAKAGLDRPKDPEAIRLVENAKKLLQFGVGLIKKHSCWDSTTAPNPAFGEECDRYYVQKANGVFAYAVTFVLLHEIAHVALGHTQTLGQYVPPHELVDQERAADTWAIEHGFTNSTTPELDVTRKCGAIAGLSALMLLSPSLTHTTHPDADDRLADGLQRLQLSDDSALWGIAALSIRLWEQVHNQPLDWPADATDFQTVLIKTMRLLRQHKR
jgi:hypothetical protein